MLKALDVGSNAAANVFWTELEDCYIFDYYTILWTIVSSTAISSNSGDTGSHRLHASQQRSIKARLAQATGPLKNEQSR